MTNIPQCCLDRLRLLRDRDEQFIMRKHRQLPVLLVPLHAVQAEGQPIRERKVHRLVEVQLDEIVQQMLADSIRRYEPRG